MPGKTKLRAQDMRRLAMLHTDGRSLRQIGGELGVSANTIGRALKRPEVQDEVAKCHEEIAAMCEDVTKRALNHITDEKLEKSSATQLATIAGINVDKATALRGHTKAGIALQINIIQDPRVAPGTGEVPVVIEGEIIDTPATPYPLDGEG